MKSFYKDKTVLVTGATGFKGSWLSIWLRIMGANVVGVSLDVPSTPSNFDVSRMSDSIEDIRLDIRDLERLKAAIQEFKPDIIFHLAAQALVKQSYLSPVETITTNAIGSMHVLEAVRQYDNQLSVVMITSDKAYDNVEWVWGYRETDALGGKDIYSASKGMAELAIKGYLESFYRNQDNIRIAVARAGNVIGGGDWANDRIVPDCMRCWSRGDVVEIRSPASTRPWQHVLEPLSGYLQLAQELGNSPELHGEAFNFGPPSSQDHTVSELIDEMAIHWKNIRWKDVSDRNQEFHEAGLLKLNCDKAVRLLEWKPAMSFQETVKMTVSWYKEFYQGNPDSMLNYCKQQIAEYDDVALKKGINWAND